MQNYAFQDGNNDTSVELRSDRTNNENDDKNMKFGKNTEDATAPESVSLTEHGAINPIHASTKSPASSSGSSSITDLQLGPVNATIIPVTSGISNSENRQRDSTSQVSVVSIRSGVDTAAAEQIPVPSMPGTPLSNASVISNTSDMSSTSVNSSHALLKDTHVSIV